MNSLQRGQSHAEHQPNSYCSIKRAKSLLIHVILGGNHAKAKNRTPGRWAHTEIQND